MKKYAEAVGYFKNVKLAQEETLESILVGAVDQLLKILNDEKDYFSKDGFYTRMLRLLTDIKKSPTASINSQQGKASTVISALYGPIYFGGYGKDDEGSPYAPKDDVMEILQAAYQKARLAEGELQKKQQSPQLKKYPGETKSYFPGDVGAPPKGEPEAPISPTAPYVKAPSKSKEAL